MSLPIAEAANDSLRRWLMASLAALIVALLCLLYQTRLIRDLSRQVGDLQMALPALADRKLAQLTPNLERRAQRIEEAAGRAELLMDGVDGRMAKSEAALLQRLEERLPQIIDRYVEQKLKTLPVSR